jgi:hypothetical protein
MQLSRLSTLRVTLLMLALIARMKPLPIDCNMRNVKPQPDFTHVLEVLHEAKPSPSLPALLTNLTVLTIWQMKTLSGFYIGKGRSIRVSLFEGLAPLLLHSHALKQ